MEEVVNGIIEKRKKKKGDKFTRRLTNVRQFRQQDINRTRATIEGEIDGEFFRRRIGGGISMQTSEYMTFLNHFMIEEIDPYLIRPNRYYSYVDKRIPGIRNISEAYLGSDIARRINPEDHELGNFSIIAPRYLGGGKKYKKIRGKKCSKTRKIKCYNRKK
jgi:hypothetical protein